MSIIERFSGVLSAAKKAWQEPVETKNAQIPANIEIPPAKTVNPYYVDTLSKIGEELPQITPHFDRVEVGIHSTTKGKVECHFEKMSADIDAELDKEDKNFDKIQGMIYQVIMMMMRLASKIDQDHIYELGIKVKKQAHEIQASYNTWQGLTVTIISSGVSMASGCAGLAPLLPLSVITADNAKNLLSASQGLGSAGTGLSGIGSIFNNRSEGSRQVMQIYLRRTQETEEERKGSKHSKQDLMKSAKAAAEEFLRTMHETARAATT
jgi:hypothetical protein